MCCVWRHHIHILGAKWEFSVTTILHSKSDWTLADRLSECRPIVKSSFMCLSYKYYMCHKSVLVHTYGRSRRSSYWSNTAVKCHLQCLYYLSPTFSNKNVVSFPKWQRMYLRMRIPQTNLIDGMKWPTASLMAPLDRRALWIPTRTYVRWCKGRNGTPVLNTS